MDSRDLTFWIAFFSVRPFGNVRDDMRMARICSVMASLWTSKGRRPREVDFMFFQEGRAAQSPAQIRAVCYQVHTSLTRGSGKRGS